MTVGKLQCVWYTKGVPVVDLPPIALFSQPRDWLLLITLDNGCWKSLFHTSVRQVKHPAPGLRYMVAGADSCIAPILATPFLAALRLVSSYLQTVNQFSFIHRIPLCPRGPRRESRKPAVDFRTLTFRSQTKESRHLRHRFWKLVLSEFRRWVVGFKFTSFFFSEKLTASKTEEIDGASHHRRRWAWNVSFSGIKPIIQARLFSGLKTPELWKLSPQISKILGKTQTKMLPSMWG
jgi:hypothetical protein